MIRFLTSFVLVAIAAATFFVFTNPLYTNLSELRVESASYDEALNNSQALEKERDKLTSKYNTFEPENREKIKKLLPDNIDNIRLILEIGKLASPNGMVLKDVKYNVVPVNNAETDEEGTVGAIQASDTMLDNQNKEYGVWDLEFSTTGTYDEFLSFLKALESNLRIVDISSISFTAGAGARDNFSAEDYGYQFKIKTYWLRN